MNVHFIAIGGAAMHNLAIALKKKGWNVSGSDDEVFEPSSSRLKAHGLLPAKMGWFPGQITEKIDLIILGMHARKDNPELLKAQELSLEINSYPEFIYNQSINKKRVVIAGSHGKTTTTSMILHVLKDLGKDFDFMVGAQIQGFDTMVSLTDAPIIILEGDEYFSSPIDMKAKFLWYKPQLTIITGIAWDHINVYPTMESYEKAFENFILSIEDGGKLIYFDGDPLLKIHAKFAPDSVTTIPYETPEYEIKDGVTFIHTGLKSYEISVFGEHNLQNMQGAKMICNALKISDDDFFTSIQSFEGAANRLEFLGEKSSLRIFKDFAHSPSKLTATVNACKKQFSDGKLLAVMELHTFSSLNKNFLSEYRNSMNEADNAIVYFNPETIEHKKLRPIEPDDIRSAFGRKDLQIVTSSEELRDQISNEIENTRTLLLMSSGNFGGINLGEFAKELLI